MVEFSVPEVSFSKLGTMAVWLFLNRCKFLLQSNLHFTFGKPTFNSLYEHYLKFRIHVYNFHVNLVTVYLSNFHEINFRC